MTFKEAFRQMILLYKKSWRNGGEGEGQGENEKKRWVATAVRTIFIIQNKCKQNVAY